MSPVVYNDVTDNYEIIPETHCGQPVEDTSCDAPTCHGFACHSCGWGCDAGLPDSACERARAEENDEQFAARVDRERAAFGLSPLQGQ